MKLPICRTRLLLGAAFAVACAVLLAVSTHWRHTAVPEVLPGRTEAATDLAAGALRPESPLVGVGGDRHVRLAGAEEPPLAPGAAPPLDLALVEARAVYSSSGEPIPFLDLRIVDRGGVGLDVRSDLHGRIRTLEPLQRGELALLSRVGGSVMFDSMRIEGARGQRRSRTSDVERVAVGAHSGLRDELDRWSVPAKRAVPLELQRPVGAGAALRVGLTTTDDPYDMVMPVVPLAAALADRDLGATSHLFFLPGQVALDPSDPQWAWRDSEASAVRPSRRVHVAEFVPGGVFVATLDAPVLPRLGETPLKLRLRLLEVEAPEALVATYGACLGAQIVEWVDRERRRLKEERRLTFAITGTIQSDSRHYDGAVSVRARSPRGLIAAGGGPRPGRAKVHWETTSSGETLGRFRIEGLEASPYRLEFSGPGTTIVEPQSLEVVAPADLTEVAIVRDKLERVEIVVTVTHPDGSPAGDFDATLTGSFRGNTIHTSIRAPGVPPVALAGQPEPTPLVVCRDLPRDATFEVELARSGVPLRTLTAEDFEREGPERTRWHAQIVVRSPPAIALPPGFIK